MTMETFDAEVAEGNRFRFGKNWRRFLSVLDESRITAAERSLRELLGVTTLDRSGFLDVGCGSGLFSLAAMRLGARRVHSFDYDPESVACAAELRERYCPGSDAWTIERGNALDADYMQSLGKWDVVYSWGVLHHTGDMWRALGNTSERVASTGTLFISIYNDQGGASRRWLAVKRLYNRGPLGRLVATSATVPYFALSGLMLDVVRGQSPIARYRGRDRARGMSIVHDWVDWIGGLPFEVARPEEIFDFHRDRGFVLQRMRTCGGGIGCNEFVFRRK